MEHEMPAAFAQAGSQIAAAVDAIGHDGVQPVAAAVAAGQPGRQAMRWTSVMSSFVLRRFCLLISTGVRTDKGFKEVHLNQVARELKEFSGNEVTGQQVYNHLRKWRQRWTRVSKLRDLSGSLWDEDNFMITLEEEHYNGHVKVYRINAVQLDNTFSHSLIQLMHNLRHTPRMLTCLTSQLRITSTWKLSSALGVPLANLPWALVRLWAPPLILLRAL
jgi:hypothetical protein